MEVKFRQMSKRTIILSKEDANVLETVRTSTRRSNGELKGTVNKLTFPDRTRFFQDALLRLQQKKLVTYHKTETNGGYVAVWPYTQNVEVSDKPSHTEREAKIQAFYDAGGTDNPLHPMSAFEFSIILDKLALPQTLAATLVGVYIRTIRHWVAGDRSIPGPAAILFRLLERGHVDIATIEDCKKPKR